MIMCLEILLAVAAVVLLLGYVLFVRTRMQEKADAFNRNENNDNRKQYKHGPRVADDESSTTAASGNATNKTGRKAAASSAATVTTNFKKQRTTEANFQHPWLYTTLKGHTRQVLDVDFSRNGKFLASCAEDSPSAQSSGNNHSINETVNENDEQNASTHPLSLGLSSSSSPIFCSVSDDKTTNVVSSSCSSIGDGCNISTTSGSNSCSSSGSTHGEDTPNAHETSKKQRKYTKKKQYKKSASNSNNCNSGNGKNQNSSSNLRQTSSSSSIASDDAVNIVQDDHVTRMKYNYYSLTTPTNCSSLTSSSPTTKTYPATKSQIVSNRRQSAISAANALWPSLPTPPSIVAAATSSLSSSIKNDNKHASYQGRLDFSSRLTNTINTATAKGGHRLDKKYNKGGNTTSGYSNSSATGGGQATGTNTSPLRQYVKLNLNEAELVKYLRKYVLDKDVMKQLGFPVEYGLDSNKAIIYKFPHDFFRPSQLYSASTPVSTDSTKKDLNDVASAEKSDDTDSGQGSGTSSPPNGDSNESLLMYRLSSDSSSLESPLSPDLQLQPSEERECCRCGKGFFITRDGEYLTQEHCVYHWGRLTRVFNGVEFKKTYSCCNGATEVKGCTVNRLHVWTGLLSGFNGPFDEFVKTQPSPRKLKKFEKLLLNKFYYQNLKGDCTDLLHDDLLLEDDESDGVYALDCEMSYTGRGLELTKVTVVSADGNLVYEKLVKPDIEIVDYNTRYSGVTGADFANSRNYVTLRQVQKELLRFIYDDTILIGHAIENDLKVLKIIHKTVIDTSITFPHMNGFPFRQSLKSLTKNILKRDIQNQISVASGSVNSKSQHHLKSEHVCKSSSTSCNDNSTDSHNSSCNNNINSNNSYGHCSLEDSRASLELMLWRVRKDKASYDNIWNNSSCYRMQNN